MKPKKKAHKYDRFVMRDVDIVKIPGEECQTLNEVFAMSQTPASGMDIDVSFDGDEEEETKKC